MDGFGAVVGTPYFSVDVANSKLRATAQKVCLRRARYSESFLLIRAGLHGAPGTLAAGGLGVLATGIKVLKRSVRLVE